ncbi:MAG: spore germination protein GerW family protein [Actinomycetota bacterium]
MGQGKKASARASRRPFAAIRRVLRARDVFGEPVERGGVTVIPVASVIGGGGAGASEGGFGQPGDDREAPARGSGGGLGYGFLARPVGAFEIRGGKVRWRPVVDVTQLGLGAMLAGLLVARWLLRNRR